MSRFVLEIGTEEIPPRFFPPALAQLREDGAKLLANARLTFEDIKVYGTPRRLVLIAEGLAARQTARTREERGPAAKVAFDAEGKPTKAAEGFARRHGLSPDQLLRRETDQGEYVFAVIQDPELPAREALAEPLPGLISGLSFPKTMRWGSGKLRFGRPVRWLLALVDEEVVDFELDGLRSGRLTRGHPVLCDGLAPVTTAAEYETTLRERSVIVDPDERRREIGHWLEAIAGKAGARVVGSALAEETVFLVEWPTAALGHFDSAFLRLPRPILIDEMEHVQSYFPLQGADGKLLPQFIAVRDGGKEHLETVLSGWESVLRAKLIDASFFYEQDLKTPLADRVEALKGVVFHEQLGTIYEKVSRLRAVAAAVAGQVSLSPGEKDALDRAALLCKADLITEVVLELSSLQGVMGEVYARESGEDPAVARAIGEHYRPRSADDAIPDTKLGRLLALSDKLDSLSALFAVGLTPTGSADPFGMRREAAGIVSIALGLDQRLSIGRLAETALDSLSAEVEVTRPRAQVIEQVLAFLGQRLQTLLREERGIRYDLVDAALAVGVDDLSRVEKRAEALRRLQPRADFLPTVVACTRPMNIAKGFEGEGVEVEPGLFVEPAETALWEAYQRVLTEADSVNLIQLFGLIAEKLRAPIDRYFDDVLVMAEDEKLRRNRLATCWQLSQLFRRVADFSLIVQA